MSNIGPLTASLKCTALRLDGHPCQAWAIRDSQPARCRVHTPEEANSRPEQLEPAGPSDPITPDRGFYDQQYTLQEIANLVSSNAADDLTDEVTAARVTVHRVLGHLEEALTPSEYAHLAQVIFTGTNTIVRLLQAQHELADPLADRFYEAIGQALDEISGEIKTSL